MTDQAKISAIAAELTRLGKLGAWKNVCGWTFYSYAVPEKVALAALSGVAADVIDDSVTVSGA